MRVLGPLLFAVFCAGCAGDAARPAEPPTRRGELPAAWNAYRAYCGLCSHSTACCLKEADFAEPRWSEAAGPYLRDLREHYECMRGDSLIDVTRHEDERLASGDVAVPVVASVRWSCEQHACMASAEAMASRLDCALDAAVPHPPGAPIACR